MLWGSKGYCFNETTARVDEMDLPLPLPLHGRNVFFFFNYFTLLLWAQSVLLFLPSCSQIEVSLRNIKQFSALWPTAIGCPLICILSWPCMSWVIYNRNKQMKTFFFLIAVTRTYFETFLSWIKLIFTVSSKCEEHKTHSGLHLLDYERKAGEKRPHIGKKVHSVFLQPAKFLWLLHFGKCVC